ncbi:MAG: PIN domain-containing protein [Candidatus Diapherotrites archaeon]
MYIDADLIYAIIKKRDRHEELAEKILSAEEKFYTSIVTMLELEIIVKRELSDELSMAILGLVKKKIPKLVIKEFDAKIMESSLNLRKKYCLGIFDSIHAATALANDKRIASTDRIYNRIPSLTRISK